MLARVVDIEYRIFLLERLTGRNLSVAEIYTMTLRDFPRKQISSRRVYDILYKLEHFENIQKVQADEDEKDVLTYTITNAGLKKKEFLIKKVAKMKAEQQQKKQ